jgi:arginine decarboxylase-like protein
LIVFLPIFRASKLRSYASQVLHARQLGINCIVVLEQYAELGVLLATARKMAVRPAIGIRAKLSTHHAG